MDKKLLLHLTNQIEWKSLLRGFLLFCGLLILKLVGFTFFPILLFVVVSLSVYISEPPERKTVFVSYIFLLASSFVILFNLPDSFNIWGTVSLLYGLLFFGLFSFINFRFKNRSVTHGAIVMLSLFSFFLALSGYSSFSIQDGWSLLFIPIAFFGMFFLIRESLTFSEKFFGRKRMVVSGSMAFLGIECMWLFQFLPLGVINASAFLAIVLSLIRDMVLANEEGELNPRFILREITIFVIVTLAFFTVSPWNL